MFETNKNIKPGQDRGFLLRLLSIVIFVIFGFLVLIFFLGNIQILQHLNYSSESKRIREKRIRIPPIRGRIFSRNQEVLAENSTAFNIYINSNDLYKDYKLRQQELMFLADALDLEYTKIEKMLKEKTKDIYEDVLIAENVSIVNFAKVKENIDLMPGVSFREVLYRKYPYKDTLSHILGYLGPISANELALYRDKDYIQSDYIGKSGIERYYEEVLRGKAGLKVYQIDAKMRKIKEIALKEKKPEPGYDIELTIDMKFQQVVEDILADRIGTIITIKPSTGEILAMASYPDFDPNIYILNTEENNRKKRENLINTTETPLINRNIQSIYPPASVFKLVTATAILNENIFPPGKRFYCNGIYWIGNESFKCWVHPGGHGSLDLKYGIIRSCDVYFYNAGLAVGPERIKNYALSYGFGDRLGIDLPFEKTGNIPSKQQMEDKGKIWTDGYTLITTIGQGDVKVTPLQIANFMSVICNKGYSYKPHLLKEIRSPENNQAINKQLLDETIQEKIKVDRIIDLNYGNEVFDYIHDSLRGVVTEGAFGSFNRNPFKIAGKTGTAEIGTGEKKQTHSWFAGFGPIDYPLDEQIVVVVLIEYQNNNYLKFAARISSLVFNSYLNEEDFHESAKRLGYPIRDSYNNTD